jgi:hypothetical protein
MGYIKDERKREQMTITEQLDAAYAAGKFAVVVTNTRITPVRDRNGIRAAKDGKGVEVRYGNKWLFAFAYQEWVRRPAAPTPP